MVRIVDAVTHPIWGQYVQRVFWIACDSTWKNWFKSVKDKHLQDRLQIYEDIRAAPELYWPTLPSVSEVPTPHDGVLDQGRRRMRAAEVREDVQTGVLLSKPAEEEDIPNPNDQLGSE